nr:hypothetical protein CFP56_17388 [Quercus suber]
MVSELRSLSMASTSSTSDSTPANTTLPVNTSLLLLSNMSSMMTVKLDYNNYTVWKHQIEVILETYSMIDILDESINVPERFLKDSSGNLTTEISPNFISWKNREQAMFTFINSTLSPAILALTVGQRSAKGVWKVSAIRTRSDVLSVEELNTLLNAEERVIKKRSNGLVPPSMAMNANFQSQHQGFSNQRGRGSRYSNQRGRGGRGNHNGFNNNYGGVGSFGHHSGFNNNNNGGFGNFSYHPTSGQQSKAQNTSGQPQSSRPFCQICGKGGHTSG